MTAYRVPTIQSRPHHQHHNEPDGAKIKRRLLMGASVLALVAASNLTITPPPAYAVICDSIGTPLGAAGATDGGAGGHTAGGQRSKSHGAGPYNYALGNV